MIVRVPPKERAPLAMICPWGLIVGKSRVRVPPDCVYVVTEIGFPVVRAPEERARAPVPTVPLDSLVTVPPEIVSELAGLNVPKLLNVDPEMIALAGETDPWLAKVPDVPCKVRDADPVTAATEPNVRIAPPDKATVVFCDKEMGTLIVWLPAEVLILGEEPTIAMEPAPPVWLRV